MDERSDLIQSTQLWGGQASLGAHPLCHAAPQASVFLLFWSLCFLKCKMRVLHKVYLRALPVLMPCESMLLSAVCITHTTKQPGSLVQSFACFFIFFLLGKIHCELMSVANLPLFFFSPPKALVHNCMLEL